MKMWQRILAILLIGVAVPAMAEEMRFGQEILEILLRAEKIDQADYERLKAKEEAEFQELQATRRALAEARKAPTLDVAAAEPEYEIKYSNGLQIQRNDGLLKLKLGGRIQADFGSVQVSDGIQDALVAAGRGNPEGTGAEFRRARLYVSGDLYDRIIFKAQYDFAGGVTGFDDVYIGMKRVGPLGTVKLGHMKEPYSLEELASSKYITFMERSLPSVYDSSRNFGLMANNHLLDKRMTWAFGAFLTADTLGKSFSSRSQWALSGRVTGLPWYADEGEKLLHLGLSASTRFQNDQRVRFRQRPEIHLTRRLLDTGNLQSDGSYLLAAEAALVHGPFSIQGEYKAGWVDQAGGSTAFLNGFYVQGSWFPTGEHRNYSMTKAVFGRISPKRPFNPDVGDWGALELALRYSFLDLDDSGINGGREQNLTLGVNWYLYSNLMMRFNYVYGDVDDTGAVLGNASGNVHALQMRTQLEF